MTSGYRKNLSARVPPPRSADMRVRLEMAMVGLAASRLRPTLPASRLRPTLRAGSGCANDAEAPTDLDERLDQAVDLRGRVRRAHLRTDARLALWHHRVEEADHVDALVEQLARELLGELGIVQHHRRDRMRARPDLEAGLDDALPEVRSVRVDAVAQVAARRQQVEHLD